MGGWPSATPCSNHGAHWRHDLHGPHIHVAHGPHIHVAHGPHVHVIQSDALKPKSDINYCRILLPKMDVQVPVHLKPLAHACLAHPRVYVAHSRCEGALVLELDSALPVRLAVDPWDARLSGTNFADRRKVASPETTHQKRTLKH